MSAQREIRLAVAEVLKASPALADGRVYDRRIRSLSSEKQTAIVIRVERSASHRPEIMGGRTTWSTLVSIECYGRSSDDSEPADQLIEQVFERLDTDPTLGGLAMDLEPLEGNTLAWDMDEQDVNLECISVRFVIKHQTEGRTLTA